MRSMPPTPTGWFSRVLDEGNHWTIIAEVPPVSKGEFYRALARDRGRLAVDDIVVSRSATERLAAVAARR